MPATPEDGRTARKRKAIIEAATTLFLRNGFLGTSMDQVAALAAVSKQTVYKQFTDKESLFTEVLLATTEVGFNLFESVDLAETEDLEKDLTSVARTFIGWIMQPEPLALRRVVIGDAGRFPELGQALWERGPQHAYSIFATWFSALHERGLLRVEDPEMAAAQFNWLVLSIPMNKVMFTGRNDYSAAELEKFAEEGVRIFLAAYGVGAV